MAEVTLPQLGETVTEGTITQWFKQVGDTVAADEPLFEVSTDKVDTEVPSPVAGTLTEIRVQEGETVEVGTVIAVVGDGDGAPAEPPAPGRRGGAGRGGAGRGGAGSRSRGASAEEPAGRGAGRRRPRQPAGRGAGSRREPAPAPEPRRRAAPSSAKGMLLSPVVRRLVNEHGLDPAAITGTGPGGRITRDDVLDHIDKAGAEPAGSGTRAGREPAERGSRRPKAGAHRPRRRRRRRPQPARRRRRSRPASATRRSSCRRSASSPAQHMIMSKGGQPARLQRRRGRLRQRRHDPRRRSRTSGSGRGLQPHLPAVHQPGHDRRPRRVPAPQRQRRRERARRAQLRRPRHRRRPRLRGAHRAGHPRRRDQAAAGHRPGDQRPRRPGADEEADARRDQRRHVHDLQQRLGRVGADDADHQPAAGGDPVDRRHHPQAGRRGDRPTAARRSPSTRSATWRWPGTTARSTAPTPPGSSSGSRRSSRPRTGRRSS